MLIKRVEAIYSIFSMKGVLGSIAQDEKFIVNRKVFQGERRDPHLSSLFARGGGGLGGGF